MTLWEGLQYINYVCVKENSGSTLSPQEYNIILYAVNIEMYNDAYNEAQLYAIQNKIPFSESIASHKALREFRSKETITFTSGACALSTLSSTYTYWGSMLAAVGGQLRKIDILTDKQLEDRRTNLLAKNLNQYPGAVINGSSILVYPSNITSAEFTYYRTPVTPVFDYFINPSGVIVPLYVGIHTPVAGEVQSDGSTSLDLVTSKYVPLEWNEERHMEFFNRVLRKVGVNLKDIQTQQYAEQVLNKQI